MPIHAIALTPSPVSCCTKGSGKMIEIFPALGCDGYKAFLAFSVALF
jgi:hypothetical protein